MAPSKKPVGRTPICDPSYVRRIDPVWVPGPVPPRFWEDPANRCDFLLWLGHKLRFRYVEDWYKLNSKHLRGKYAGGLKNKYWHNSPIEAVRECFPEYDWKEWLFAKVSSRFWYSRANRRKYLGWLGERLGYQQLDDWYRVTQKDFVCNRGMVLLQRYSSAPWQAVMDLIPRRDWHEWKFTHVAKGFWDVAKNRHRYLRWLGRQLRFRRPYDWYRISYDDFAAHHGLTLLRKYPSLNYLMREFLPGLDWNQVNHHLTFTVEEVLAWADAYHAEQGTWPMAALGQIAGTGHTWQTINSCLWYGRRGLPGGGSLARFLREHRGVEPGRRPPSLSEEQILRWADDYFAAHGKWPKAESGIIPGTRETWNGIRKALRAGNRGLSGGSTLAQLLAKRRGVRNIHGLPRLPERKIMTWARAHFAAVGCWPAVQSGPIPQSPGDTWLSVDKALRNGSRGLPGGSSLYQLLKAHSLAKGPRT